MTVQAGESPAQAAPQAAMVNADELAKSIVNAVAAVNLQQQAAPSPVQQASVDIFKAKADEMLKSERIDKDVMPIMLELMEAMKSQLTEEQKREAMKVAQEAQTKNLHAELGRMVDRFAATVDDGDLAREMKVAIIKNAIDEYNADPVLVNRYMRDGSLDWKKLEDSIAKRVTKLGGVAKKEDKPAGGPAMKNEAPAGSVETRKEFNKDMLDERQMEIFNSQTSFGMKQMGLDRQKAETRALERISQAETKLKSAKR